MLTELRSFLERRAGEGEREKAQSVLGVGRDWLGSQEHILTLERAGALAVGGFGRVPLG